MRSSTPWSPSSPRSGEVRLALGILPLRRNASHVPWPPAAAESAVAERSRRNRAELDRRGWHMQSGPKELGGGGTVAVVAVAASRGAAEDRERRDHVRPRLLRAGRRSRSPARHPVHSLC